MSVGHGQFEECLVAVAAVMSVPVVISRLDLALINLFRRFRWGLDRFDDDRLTMINDATIDPLVRVLAAARKRV